MRSDLTTPVTSVKAVIHTPEAARRAAADFIRELIADGFVHMDDGTLVRHALGTTFMVEIRFFDVTESVTA